MRKLFVSLLSFLLISIKVIASNSSYSPDYEAYDKEDEARYRMWQERYPRSSSLIPDVGTVSRSEYDKAFSDLTLNEKPLAYRGEIYSGNPSGKKTVHTSAGEAVSYVSSSHMNYIQRDEELLSRYEAFAVPQVTNPKLKRHEPSYVELYSLADKKMVIKKKDKRSLKATDTELVFDAGHGVDHAKTIVHKGSNSSWDIRNYTPQNAYYNRYIRMPLVKYADENGYSYKELAIYGEKPLFITRKSGIQEKSQPIPEGFIFFLLNRNSGAFGKAYYFPNFYHYKQAVEGIPEDQTPWKFFAKKYKIPKKVAQDIWGYNEITDKEKLRQAKWLSSHVGYRSLSGRYEVLPTHTWSSSARNALVRTAAIYRMERAAEYDTSVENMLQIAQMFNDRDFRYLEFQGTLYSPHLAQYWTDRAFEEVQRKSYPAEDIFYFAQYETQIPLRTGMMAHLMDSFQKQLLASPNAEHTVKLLEYLNDRGDEDSYRVWSDRLSSIVRQAKMPGSIVINDDNIHQLVETLSNTSIVNIILDFNITPHNFGNILEGFKQRAIREQSLYERNLNFLEVCKISPDLLKAMFHTFEYGIVSPKGEVFVDVRETAIKLPAYKRKKVQDYMQTYFPKTLVSILN